MGFSKNEINDVFKQLGLEDEKARAKKLFEFSQNTKSKQGTFVTSEGTSSSLEKENAFME